MSFSGIDGAGKSTQIAALYHSLERAGMRVQLLTFWDDVACLGGERASFQVTRFLREIKETDHQRSRFTAETEHQDLVFDHRSLSDLLPRRPITAESGHPGTESDADVVIFDRYIYDELANLSLKNPLTRAYARLLLTLAPQPDVAYLLDADPVAARERKPEYPIEFLHANRAAYLALPDLARRITVIEPMPQREVERRVTDSMCNADPRSTSR